MAAAIASAISMFGQALLDSPVGPFVQELMVLGIFGVSFLAWRSIMRGKGRRGLKGKALAKQDFDMLSAAEAAVAAVADGRKGSSDQRHLRAMAATHERSMMHKLERREFTPALNVYRGLEKEGRGLQFSEELYFAFVQSAIRVTKLDVIERMLDGMRKNGPTPSKAFWRSTVKMLSGRRHFDACVSIYSSFADLVPADKEVLSCFINAALETGQPQRAAAMLKVYCLLGNLAPKDYVCFFRTYQVLGDVDSAEGVFRKLGADTAPLMLNLMLLTCARSKQAERGLSLLNEAHGLERPGRDNIVDVVSYNTVIKGFVLAQQASQCFACLQQMRDRGMEPDAITYGAVLDLCTNDGQVDAACQLMNSLMENSQAVGAGLCTQFVRGLVKANALDRALKLCEEMRRGRGACPDVVFYSVLIKALVDQHDLDQALALLQEMIDAGVQPDDLVFGHLLEGCRHASKYDVGKSLFEAMLASGTKPSEYTLMTMLKLHGRCGEHQAAFDLLADAEKRFGVKPSVIHYTCLMSGCLRNRSYEQAWTAYELMCTSGIEPDSTALTTLLPGLIAAQQWERVVEIAEIAMQKGPHCVRTETLNSALAQLQAAGGDGRLAGRLRELMVAAGVPGTRRNMIASDGKMLGRLPARSAARGTWSAPSRA